MNNPLKLIAGATALLITAGTILTVSNAPAIASSHSDAPTIKQDPQANLTDVYAFIGTKYPLRCSMSSPASARSLSPATA